MPQFGNFIFPVRKFRYIFPAPFWPRLLPRGICRCWRKLFPVSVRGNWRCICARKDLWKGRCSCWKGKKKDNNIIIPTYLSISQNVLLLGERKEQNRKVKNSAEWECCRQEQMMNIFQDILPYGVFGKSRAINAENPTGEKGKRGWSIPVPLKLWAYFWYILLKFGCRSPLQRSHPGKFLTNCNAHLAKAFFYSHSLKNRIHIAWIIYLACKHFFLFFTTSIVSICHHFPSSLS